MDNAIPEKGRFAVINEFGGPEVFSVIDAAIPAIKPDQILIEVHAVSINPIDWKQRKGNHRFLLGAPFPITLGYDVAGRVVACGEQTEKFKVGDEVLGVLDNKYGGAYGEYARGTEKCFVKRPDQISIAKAAALPMVTLTSLQALRDKAELKSGEVLLVNGASGGVGHVAVQIGKILGAHVIGVSSGKNEAFVRELGADEFIDYRKSNVINSEKKVDVFFDAAGIYSFPGVKNMLNAGGRYVNTLPRPKILWHKVLQLFTEGKKTKTLLMNHNPQDLLEIVNWVVNGRLEIKIDSSFEFSEIEEAHLYAEQGHSNGKNVIVLKKS
ncbi:NAD(P)-dependent alcohol dehydrogenase [Salinivirga cyanobacteriivorans]